MSQKQNCVLCIGLVLWAVNPPLCGVVLWLWLAKTSAAPTASTQTKPGKQAWLRIRDPEHYRHKHCKHSFTSADSPRRKNRNSIKEEKREEKLKEFDRPNQEKKIFGRSYRIENKRV